MNKTRKYLSSHLASKHNNDHESVQLDNQLYEFISSLSWSSFTPTPIFSGIYCINFIIPKAYPLK